MILKVLNLSHCFIEKVLYNNASFELYKGEHIGVVGQNGVGKSTLIKILLGEIIPDIGQIKWQSNLKIGHLDQYAQIDENISILDYLHTSFEDLYLIEQKMNKLYEGGINLIKASEYQQQLIDLEFYSIDSEINKVVNGLGINAIGVDSAIGTLSGGQRAKVIMAKLLLTSPDILLLDEPTNFLDKEHIEWLSNYLNSFKGAYIVVSHDFDFLDKITTGILDIEFGTIKKYSCRYSEFIKQKAHLREEYIRQYHSQQKRIEQTEEYIRKNKAGVNSKIARGRQKQLDRMEKINPPEFVQKPNIKFRQLDLLVQKALVVNNLEVGYYYPLLPKLSFDVAGGQKLVITGFNGIGKSTLLKTLVKIVPCISGNFQFSDQVKIGYYEQDLIWDNPQLTPFQIINEAYPKLTKKEIRKALAQCAIKEDNVSRSISTLSGGEQSKVKLCKMLLTPYNFLILDEPTNHLDAETKEVLQNELTNFKGSIILVSHEQKFYNKWADKIINIENITN